MKTAEKQTEAGRVWPRPVIEDDALPVSALHSSSILRPSSFSATAFTLIELVLVMALLVTLLAIAAPSLSRTMRQRNLDQQAARLLALTEYGRDEAASQGVPVLVWIDPDSRHFGIDVKSGFDASTVRVKEYVLPGDLSFNPPEGGIASRVAGHGLNVAEFAPDGTLDPASVASLGIVDHDRTQTVSVTQTTDGYGYEIVKPRITQP